MPRWPAGRCSRSIISGPRVRGRGGRGGGEEARRALRLRESRRCGRRRSLRAPPGRGSRAGGPNAIWVAVEAEHEVPDARLLDVVGGDDDRAASGGEVVDQAVEQLRAGRVQAGVWLVEQQQAGVGGQGPGDQGALALAPGHVAEGVTGPVGEPDHGQRFCCHLPVLPARPPPPRQSGERAHRRHVEAAHRVVEAGAVGLGDGRAGNPDFERAGEGSQLSEQRPEERRLAAAVRPEQADPGTRLNFEVDTAQYGSAFVAEREPLRRSHGSSRVGLSAEVTATFPPVSPRTTLSAFDSIIPAQVSAPEPSGPRVSP